MKRCTLSLSLLIFLVCAGAAAAETTVSEKQESAESPRIEIIENAPSAAYKDALMEAVSAFWQAKIEGNLAEAYDWYLPDYKQAVTFQRYQNQKRAIVEEFTIASATFWKESCALVKLRLHLKTEVMDLKSAPATQQWTLQDGKWMLFENPAKNSMFPSRKGNGLTSPCAPIPKPERPPAAPAKPKGD